MAELERPELDLDLVRLLVDDPLLLEDRDDVDVLVPRLSSQAFVGLARQLREEQRLELLLPYASADQLTSLIDLDGWVGERVDVVRARRWLAAIARAYETAERSRGELVALMYRMDPEMWTYALGAGTMIIDLVPGDDEGREQAYEQLSGRTIWESPDGYFLIGVRDDELGQAALSTLRRVYHDDLSEARKLCLSIQSALPSMIEEELRGWRSGRLADLGFVEWEEAMKLLRPLDHRAAATEGPGDFAYLRGLDVGQALYHVKWPAADLVRRVMDRLDDAEHGLRTREFLLLVNEVMAAQRREPGDEAAQTHAIDQTESTITLGLSLLAGTQDSPQESGDLESFLAERVRALGLRRIFRVGYGALDKLRKAAQELHRSGRISLRSPGSLLDRPWGPSIASLSGLLPELPVLGRTAGTRPIRSLRDVAEATRRVAEAGALARLTWEGYGIDAAWLTRVDEPEKIVLGDLVRTAIVAAALPGSRGPLVPLSADDLAWAQENLLDAKGSLVASVRADFDARLSAIGLIEHAPALAETLLMRLSAELAILERADDRVDLGRVGGLLTVQSVGMWLTTTQGDPN